jgi:dUTP pyrophosphatase
MSETTIFENIDTNEKAYCLGFFSYIDSSHSSFSKNSYELSNIDVNEDKEVLNLFDKIVDVIYDEEHELTSLNIIDKKILEDINLNINKFDEWTDKQKKEYIRGLYEYNYLTNDFDNDDIYIKKNKNLENVIDKIGSFLNIPYIYINDGEYFVIKYGCNSVDFLGSIYNNINNNLSIKYCNYNLSIPRCCVVKTDDNAIFPSKENWSDVGYDLSIIKKIKDLNSKTALYDTGVKIQIDFGYYAEIVPRSSISKTGYILANNVGIIDNSYRGNLMIALTKIADDAIDITFPFKCCQLIFKRQIYVNLEEIKKLDETKRNEGGFGSTG